MAMSRVSRTRSSRNRPRNGRVGIPRPVLVRDVEDNCDPPRLPAETFLPMVIRYQKTSATRADVFWRCLANLLIVSTGTTSGYVLYSQFKPTKLVAYGLASAASSATGYSTPPVRLITLGVPSTDTANNPIQNRKVKEDVSTNDRGCMVSLPFPGAGNWYDVFGVVSMTNTGSCFTLDGPIGTLLDLHIVFNLSGMRTTLPKTSSTSGATAQVLYYNLLDNTNATGAAGTSFLTPISCATGNVNGAVWL